MRREPDPLPVLIDFSVTVFVQFCIPAHRFPSENGPSLVFEAFMAFSVVSTERDPHERIGSSFDAPVAHVMRHGEILVFVDIIAPASFFRVWRVEENGG